MESDIYKVLLVTNTSWWIRNSLFLRFCCYKQATFEEMKAFVQTLYHYHFVGTVNEDNNDEEDEMTNRHSGWEEDEMSDRHSEWLASSWWPATCGL